MGKSCCFTGHRRIPYSETAGLKIDLRQEIRRLIENEGVTRFVAGGAVGFDTLAELAVLELKQEYPDTELWLILPCGDQADRWNQRDRELYEDILSRADKTTVVSPRYTPSCMRIRNDMLLLGSNFCLAYLKQMSGGTAYTVARAFERGVQVINLAR